MTSIHQIIYNMTGRMTKRHIMKTAEKIGLELASKGKNIKEITLQDIRNAAECNIGKKKASRIIISDNLDEFKNFAKENLNFSNKLAEDMYNSSVAIAVPSYKNKGFLKIDLKDFNKISKICNTIGHEFEHLLFQNFGFRTSFERLYIKLRGKKYLNKYLEKNAPLINEKNMEIQYYLLALSNMKTDALSGFCKYKRGFESILAQTNTRSKREFQNILKEIVNLTLLPDENKVNKKILKSLKQILKDESRAYNVGAKVEKSFYPGIKRATKSEMLADLYDETIKAINEELKSRKQNPIKKLLQLFKKDKK